MNNSLIILIIALFISVGVKAQKDTLGNEVVYYAEQKLHEPNSGLITYVPRGWVGVVPMDDEDFLLVPVNSTNAQIQIIVYEMKYLSVLQKRLENGLTIANGLIINPTENIKKNGEWLASSVSIKRAGEESRGYVEGTCNGNGHCVLNVLISSRKDLDALKQSMDRLTRKTTFESNAKMGSTK